MMNRQASISWSPLSPYDCLIF